MPLRRPDRPRWRGAPTGAAATPPGGRLEGVAGRRRRRASSARAAARGHRNRTAVGPARPRPPGGAARRRARSRRRAAADHSLQRLDDALGAMRPTRYRSRYSLFGRYPFPPSRRLARRTAVIERQVLQPVDRVVMHEALHRPELRHRLARLVNQPPHGCPGHESRRPRGEALQMPWPRRASSDNPWPHRLSRRHWIAPTAVDAVRGR